MALLGRTLRGPASDRVIPALLVASLLALAWGCSTELLPASEFAPVDAATSADGSLADAVADAATDAGADAPDLAGDVSETDAAGDGASSGDADLPGDTTTTDVGPDCTVPADCDVSQGPAGSCLLWLCLQQSCKLAVASSGAACNDGDPCLEHQCDGAGTCVVGSAKTCPGGPCLVGLCDPGQGGCVQLAATAGTQCDDGDACTGGDVCGADGCSGDVTTTCTAGACEIASCDPKSGTCKVTTAPDAQACEDGDLCTSGETCTAGVCKGGAAKVCSGDTSPCQLASCDPKTGACVVGPAADGSMCDDGQTCTSGDACAAGVCKPGNWTCDCQGDAGCDDNNGCTADTCDAGKCTFAVTSGQSCDDGNACTDKDACDAGGTCVGATSTDCDDGNACTLNACDAKTGGCSTTPLSAGACDDGDLCTAGESCVGGYCQGGQPKNCPDSGPCLSGSCDAKSGNCKTTETSGACSDGDGCVIDKSCKNGTCSGGKAKDCDDDNPCTADTCNPQTGTCLHTPQPDGASCGKDRVCSAGACTCVLGKGTVPENGWETLFGVAPDGAGYVAVGESNSGGLKRGLLVRFGPVNQLNLIRRHGDYDPNKGGAMTFHAVVPVASGYRVATTRTLMGGHVARLDEQGNLAGWMGPDGMGDSRDLVGMSDGVVHVGYNGDSGGYDGIVTRYGDSGGAKWKTALSESNHEVQAWGGVFHENAVYVVGQQREFGEDLRRAWVARLDTQGKLSWRKSLFKDYMLAYAVVGKSANALWITGQKATGSDAKGVLLNVDLPAGSVAQSALSSTAFRFYGVAPNGGHAMLAGVGDFGDSAKDDGVWSRSDANQYNWSQHDGGSSDDALYDVAALPDGTWVSVGSYRTSTKRYAWWVRFNGDGKTSCGP